MGGKEDLKYMASKHNMKEMACNVDIKDMKEGIITQLSSLYVLKSHPHGEANPTNLPQYRIQPSIL